MLSMNQKAHGAIGYFQMYVQYVLYVCQII